MAKNITEYIDKLHNELNIEAGDFKHFDLGKLSEKKLEIYSFRNSTNFYEIIKNHLNTLSDSFEKILQAEFEDMQNSKTNPFVLHLPINSAFAPRNTNQSPSDLIRLDSANLMLILKLLHDILQSPDKLTAEDIIYLEKAREKINKYRQMFRSQFIRIKKAASVCEMDTKNYDLP